MNDHKTPRAGYIPTRRSDWMSSRAQQDFALRRMANMPWADGGPTPTPGLTKPAIALLVIALAIPFALPSYFSEPALEQSPVPAADEARLVGLGCGPKRLTFYAVEEDDFPRCETIDTPENLCGPGVSAPDCAAYLGEGW